MIQDAIDEGKNEENFINSLGSLNDIVKGLSAMISSSRKLNTQTIIR